MRIFARHVKVNFNRKRYTWQQKTLFIAKAKPFIKWFGGKGQLLDQLETLLPADFDNWNNVTHIEPFVGGGVMLFRMLQNHRNVRHAVINDINHDPIVCYQTVRDNSKCLNKP